MNQTPDQASYPVEDLTSNDMACGITGETGVSRVCAANQSSTLTFQFRQYPDASQAGVIASSHVGPCAVYLKQVSSAISDPGYGDGWFKICESGYDEDTQEWCTTKLINAGGLLSVDMPSDLAGGYYLVRPELLALHNANAGDPQFYTGCAQMFLDSDATAVPTETVAIPGYVTKDDPSVTYNIYTTPLSLPYPKVGAGVVAAAGVDEKVADVKKVDEKKSVGGEETKIPAEETKAKVEDTVVSPTSIQTFMTANSGPESEVQGDEKKLVEGMEKVDVGVNGHGHGGSEARESDVD